jgi:hypothetical protein
VLVVLAIDMKTCFRLITLSKPKINQYYKRALLVCYVSVLQQQVLGLEIIVKKPALVQASKLVYYREANLRNSLYAESLVFGSL